jgi:hypothetical protein
VLLFDRADAELIVWSLPDQARTIASPREGYAKLAASNPPTPQPGELRIDRAWAVQAARTLIEAAS